MLDTILHFLAGYTSGPFERIAQIGTLDPSIFPHSILMLAALFFFNDLLRTALMTECTRSVLAHVIVCVLTLLPGILLGVIILFATHRYPDRIWINFGWAAVLYLPWIAGGAVTRLSRSDSEGTDLGWIAHGAAITVVLGLLAAVLFR